MKKWSIQVTVTKRDDDNKPFQMRTVFWTESDDIPGAYREADKMLEDYPTAKFGAIIPGHVERFF